MVKAVCGSIGVACFTP
ncbi:DUF3265 domain-containing protein [Vibrio parahaemolyticus]|nr:DUF3265 domain-containing protein [Vibrio parahaemolyticus]MDF4912381.1 DUF3265 domain-containing protein [Vibrio parahaemolyticus]